MLYKHFSKSMPLPSRATNGNGAVNYPLNGTTCSSEPNSRHKSVQFDLGHNTSRILPRDSGKAWKKLEKQIAELGLNSPTTLAFGDYFVCERRGHPEVIIRSPPCQIAAKLMAEGALCRVDLDIIHEADDRDVHHDPDRNDMHKSHVNHSDHEDMFAMDSDDSGVASSGFTGSKGGVLQSNQLDPQLVECALRKYMLSKVPHHSILHYPEDKNMFIDWRQLEAMVQHTESLPEDLEDTEFGIKKSNSNKSSSASKISSPFPHLGNVCSKAVGISPKHEPPTLAVMEQRNPVHDYNNKTHRNKGKRHYNTK